MGRAQHRQREGRCAWRGRGRHGAPVDLAGQFLGVVERLGAELAAQHLLAAVVRPQRRRAVATQVVQAHDEAPRLLGHRVEFQQCPGVGQGGRVVAGLFQAGHLGPQREPPPLVQVFAFGRDPVVQIRAVVVAHPGQEVTAVGMLVFQAALSELLAAAGDVDLGAGHEFQQVTPGDEVAARGQAELAQHLDEVVAGGRLGGLGPQQPGQA